MQRTQKLCDWRPGGAMLYCKRPDGPWILSGIEDFAESCNSEVNEGNEVIRPALFSSIESMAGWMTVTSGVVSQIYPYQCGGDDVTRAQKRGVCGRPKIPFNLNLFDPVDASNAEDAWHQMMEEVKAYHPDFPRNHFHFTNSQEAIDFHKI